jgi:hypothetical protein
MVRDAGILEKMRASRQKDLPDVFTGPLGTNLWSIMVDFAYDGGRLMDAILDHPDFDPEEQEEQPDTAGFTTNHCLRPRYRRDSDCLTHLRLIHIHQDDGLVEAHGSDALRYLLEPETEITIGGLIHGIVQARNQILDNARSKKSNAIKQHEAA